MENVTTFLDNLGILSTTGLFGDAFSFPASRIVAMSFCEPRSCYSALLPKTAWPPDLKESTFHFHPQLSS